MMIVLLLLLMIDDDHDRHQRRTEDADGQHNTAVVRPKRKLLSTQKTRTAKRSATRAMKT